MRSAVFNLLLVRATANDNQLKLGNELQNPLRTLNQKRDGLHPVQHAHKNSYRSRRDDAQTGTKRYSERSGTHALHAQLNVSRIDGVLYCRNLL